MSDNIVQFPGKATPDTPNALPLADLMGTPSADVRFLQLDVQLEIMRGVYVQMFTSTRTPTAYKAELLASGVPHLIELADTIFKGISLPPEDAAVWFESPDPLKRSIDLVVGLGDYREMIIAVNATPAFTRVKRYLQMRLTVVNEQHVQRPEPKKYLVTNPGDGVDTRLNAAFAPCDDRMTCRSICSIVEAALVLVRKNCLFNTARIYSHPVEQNVVEFRASLPFGADKSIAVTITFDGQLVND